MRRTEESPRYWVSLEASLNFGMLIGTTDSWLPRVSLGPDTLPPCFRFPYRTETTCWLLVNSIKLYIPWQTNTWSSGSIILSFPLPASLPFSSLPPLSSLPALFILFCFVFLRQFHWTGSTLNKATLVVRHLLSMFKALYLTLQLYQNKTYGTVLPDRVWMVKKIFFFLKK